MGKHTAEAIAARLAPAEPSVPRKPIMLNLPEDLVERLTLLAKATSQLSGQKITRNAALHHGGVLPIAGHVEELVPEPVEAPPEDLIIQELILAEDVQGLVCDWGAREQHPIAGRRAHAVHRLVLEPRALVVRALQRNGMAAAVFAVGVVLRVVEGVQQGEILLVQFDSDGAGGGKILILHCSELLFGLKFFWGVAVDFLAKPIYFCRRNVYT